ncbi:hypothetical protein PUNSTDRAFT_121211 [Punctularia strigosozonata HHB-11173 SS5]|uniref:uncharacterized protein n=1 Tax=Punctularia strigosozonata (strain HHB-11173) TaxID=741275 RepID=UPI0004418452|nr:uncharacterized protein PUNSTDRAFT_121211 [Punctularia strigosozonata HHB-11173 SS5]EIN08109.1 hypothetical protein PUNSTDRAFT_121211 [Punctularia strigosozonata HHB-11173 SS5]
MERATSIFAALDAGKIPSQKQVDSWIDWLIHSGLVQVEPSGSGGELSVQGKILINDIREVLEAYRELGNEVNGDDVIQDALYHLGSGDLKNTGIDTDSMDVDLDEATRDINALRASLRTLISHLYAHISVEGQGLFYDFASFTRLTLADGAELIERAAASTKQTLREIDSEVQSGERNPGTGTKRPADGDPEDADARVKFEKTMDQVKVAGSNVIGAGQKVQSGAQDISERSSSRLNDAYYKMCDRAQSDKDYQQAVSTIFDLFQKWLDKALETAADVNADTSLETFIDDPTPEQHVPKAIRSLRTLIERLAGDKPLDDLLAALRTCAADIRTDSDTRKWFDNFFNYMRKSLKEPGFVRSEESSQQYDDLRERWQALLDADSDYGRKWKKDVDGFKGEIDSFEQGIRSNKKLDRVRKAHVKLQKDIEEDMWIAQTAASGVQKSAQVAASGLGSALSQSTWILQDMFNAYLPRLLGLLKDVPIPRTEYKDKDTDFVLEDLDISTLSLLPGHVYIRNITDVDISASAAGQAQTAMGAYTHIHATGVQLQLKEVSFYYLDKSATVGPSEFTGIMEVTLPPKGIDIDLRVRMLPNTASGLKEREKRGGFHKIEDVKVEVTDEVDINIKSSNHSVLVTVFKPLLVSRFRSTLATTLAEQIKASLEFADRLAWDVGCRAEVFGDTGLPRSASILAAIWSEIGHYSKGQGGATSGWRATGTGFIKGEKGDDFQIAMGVEPQILPGEKRGPKGTFSEPAAEKVKRAAAKVGEELDIDVQDVQSSAQEGAQKGAETAKKAGQVAADTLNEGARKVRTFRESVEAKVEQEKSSEGWRSSAFDL